MSTSNKRKGFTLIEILIAIGLSACIATFLGIESIGSFHAATERLGESQALLLKESHYGMTVRHINDVASGTEYE